MQGLLPYLGCCLTGDQDPKLQHVAAGLLGQGTVKLGVWAPLYRQCMCDAVIQTLGKVKCCETRKGEVKKKREDFENQPGDKKQFASSRQLQRHPARNLL
jgi:hypothetical protein